MEGVIDWLTTNKDWVFSGVGIVFLGLIGRLLFKKMGASSIQSISSGDRSTNVQAGRDVGIGTRKMGNDAEEE